MVYWSKVLCANEGGGSRERGAVTERKREGEKAFSNYYNFFQDVSFTSFSTCKS